MIDRYHLLIAHHPIHILKLSIFIIVVGGIAGIKPEALSPLLFHPISESFYGIYLQAL